MARISNHSRTVRSMPEVVSRRIALVGTVLSASCLLAVVPVRSDSASGNTGAVATLVPGVSFRDEALSFEERMWYQRRIEEVYWAHRIWPAENPGPKPSLDEVLPEAVLRDRVASYLGKSTALEHYWSRPLSGEQLQAEINRMVRSTKNPDMLRELFAALDDDPFLIKYGNGHVRFKRS